jgi:hypothetical protein
MDFSEFETTAGGTWQLAGVIDYVAEYSLACPAFGTQTAADVIASVQGPMEHAEWVLGIPLKEYLVDATTGEVHPLVLVTDNGPAFKSSPVRSARRLTSGAQPRAHPAPFPPDQRSDRTGSSR